MLRSIMGFSNTEQPMFFKNLNIEQGHFNFKNTEETPIYTKGNFYIQNTEQRSIIIPLRYGDLIQQEGKTKKLKIYQNLGQHFNRPQYININKLIFAFSTKQKTR